MKKILLSSFIVLCLSSMTLFAKEYVLDKTHSNVGFKTKHLQISNVRGNFQDYDGVIDFDPANFEFKKIQANIKVASINTQNQRRDDHLNSDDFFKIDNFPDMTFVMKEYQKIDNEKGKMRGILTITGIAKDVVLDTEIGGVIQDPQGKERIGFSLNGKINRLDFNLGPNIPSAVLSHDVDINVEIEAIEK